ncbi:MULTISPECIES: bifunctional 2-polyprenyl-6-hydroxyphenol methylase/3-demethylubiquinol 3-O-methyltransferase UbiG [unclassified Imperialibacter]|uniref:class I SAM-dependent methyltransferase n=1 Tax=unclassified Imperialibacter TaxID=2629706 RepID=UPI00125510BB|nr:MULTISPECIES: class I SAM-dependent methyltransferase [unclassified Imperialibacter]CAD5269436.1 Methyltransferase domain-containing protein [Imperialibacter sp. 89]CAD5297588.1 Methyltransferase domain-containing protein [Imperialibacter sp. 75]VVT34148.1 Methyltransferase domain-containing protein [Imperialibacter sp. EC-SDR9]
MNFRELNTQLGNIDIYLLDQILKGRFEGKSKVLDVGCGEGRNLIYFAKEGFDVYGFDQSPSALQMLRYLLKGTSQGFDERKLIEGNAKSLPLPAGYFDIVISSAVLHFAESVDAFHKQMAELFRVLAPDGILFIRMTSDIGLPDATENLGNGRYLIPDGSARFLLTRSLIKEIVDKFSWQLIEPVKTTVVDDVRCMTTLVFRKD